ncbi:ADP-ribosylglycohydrolase family protein [Actinomadura logoneensis]|uniref:ADP-ribosylglycohydrolase family protein n=1 Tax=Actinomadura logoneensis TaxID=2293572 RepID=A0A372JE02_9ACTN|nr:ADP-ribosylglycohydrolase family protein [Actinomadura logoneensis]RFU38241.1 ADP-ribosylglycohydrolase family protein [Actinomadura logoneensis]
MHRTHRAIGAVVGSALGDALGAPYEFGPANAFSQRFPTTPAPMRPGGGWDEGEATDDTQMAVLVAESLLDRGRLDLPDMFERFVRWAASDPKDIGLQTEAVLTSGDPWDMAAGIHFQGNLRAAGNGGLMRAAPSAVFFAAEGREATMEAGRRITALTHGDGAAWEGTAILHDLIRVALDGEDPIGAVPQTLAHVRPRHRERYARVLDPGWHPDDATEFNGAVWPCLGSAVWAVRTTSGFVDALRAAIDLGGDTDTVAAVTGALAGAVYGVADVPDPWRAALHVPLPGFGRVLRFPELRGLAERLVRGRAL